MFLSTFPCITKYRPRVLIIGRPYILYRTIIVQLHSLVWRSFPYTLQLIWNVLLHAITPIVITQLLKKGSRNKICRFFELLKLLHFISTLLRDIRGIASLFRWHHKRCLQHNLHESTCHMYIPATLYQFQYHLCTVRSTHSTHQC